MTANDNRTPATEPPAQVAEAGRTVRLVPRSSGEAGAIEAFREIIGQRDEARKELATLRDQLQAARNESARLREANRALYDALAFYGEQENYSLKTWDYDKVASEVQYDEGETARVVMIKANRLEAAALSPAADDGKRGER